MNTGAKSLRSLVGKWFGVDSPVPVQVVEFGRTIPGRRRYVRIGASVADDALTIVFFRQDDGSWNVFPPMPKSLVMRP